LHGQVVFVLFLLRLSKFVVHNREVPGQRGDLVVLVNRHLPSPAVNMEPDLQELFPFLNRDALVPRHLLRDLGVFGVQRGVFLRELRVLRAKRGELVVGDGRERLKRGLGLVEINIELLRVVRLNRGVLA